MLIGFDITYLEHSAINLFKKKSIYWAIGNAMCINCDRTQEQQSHALLLNLSLLLEISH